MLFRQVRTIDRLPQVEEWYFTNLGQFLFDPTERVFRYQYNGRIVDIAFWYEPVEMPTNLQIDNLAKELAKESTAPDKDTPDWMESDIRRGIKVGINLLINENGNF